MEYLFGLLVVLAFIWWLANRDTNDEAAHSDSKSPLTTQAPSSTGRTRARNRRRAVQATAPSFAVLDVETSAMRPRDGRIIEIGLVHLDPSGEVTHRWETLINPGDGIAGRTDIHGIDAEWLAAAPNLSEVAGDIVERLRGRVLVAHNATFDTAWLDSEFNRLANPFGDYGAVCTMEIAGMLGLPRKLSSAARTLGHEFNHHTAVEDAEAAGLILRAGLRAGLSGHEHATLSDGVLPRGLAASGTSTVRVQAAKAIKPRPFLSDVMLSSTMPNHDLDEDAYLDVLERALEDGYLDPHEQEELVGLASDLGLTDDRAMELHEELIDSMVLSALDDNIVTRDERHQIEQAAAWLGVELTDWRSRVGRARRRIREAQSRFHEEMNGKSVAFTGRGGHPKDIREALAAKFGIEASTRVSQRTDIVAIGSVEVDNQQTSKAKERELPVMLESALWSRLGATTPETPEVAAKVPATEPESPVGFQLADEYLDGVAPGEYRGRLYHEWIETVRQLRREGRVVDAELILVGCIQATESEADREGLGWGVAPAYYRQLAILYSKARRYEDELAVLERFANQPHAPGAEPAKLLERLDKARGRRGA